MKYLRTYEEIDWGKLNPFSKSEPKVVLTKAEKMSDELNKLKEVIENKKLTIPSEIDSLKFTGDIPKGTKDEDRFWHKHSVIETHFKREFIEKSLSGTDLDLKSIVGDHKITSQVLWSDDDKNISYIEFKIEFELIGKFKDVGTMGYSYIRIFKNMIKERKGDENCFCIRFEYGRRDGRYEGQTLKDYISKSLFSLKNHIIFELKKLHLLINKSLESIEKDKRKEVLISKIESIKECFYDIIDISENHDIFIKDSGEIHCEFKIKGIIVKNQQKSKSGSSKGYSTVYIDFDEAKFDLNDVLFKVFGSLMEAKPRVNDIVPGAEFKIELSKDEIKVLIS